MDETDSAQTPVELLIILAAIADEQIPLQTIAPKFSGRFNKGVDYVGNVEQFEKEIALDFAANAGFLSAYLRGVSPTEAARTGNVTGALSTLASGGTEAFRDRNLRQSFLSQNGGLEI
jgi:hypothetical protein